MRFGRIWVGLSEVFWLMPQEHCSDMLEVCLKKEREGLRLNEDRVLLRELLASLSFSSLLLSPKARRRARVRKELIVCFVWLVVVSVGQLAVF